MWEIILAFVGGGIVSLLYQYLSDLRNMKNMKKALSSEIKVIILQTEDFLKLGNNRQYLIQPIYTPIFESDPSLIIAFVNQQEVLEFYHHITLLRLRDRDNDYIEGMYKQKNYNIDIILKTQEDVSNLKDRIRNEIVEKGKRIIS